MKQYKLKEALALYPDIILPLVYQCKGININDDDYIVRIDVRNGMVELGYEEDEWNIKDEIEEDNKRVFS